MVDWALTNRIIIISLEHTFCIWANNESKPSSPLKQQQTNKTTTHKKQKQNQTKNRFVDFAWCIAATNTPDLGDLLDNMDRGDSSDDDNEMSDRTGWKVRIIMKLTSRNY